MFVSGDGGELSIALVNAVLLALWAVLPVLLLGYGRQSLAARRMRPEFSLRKSEANELNRALALYGKVRRRLQEIDAAAESPKKNFWRALFDRRADARPPHADEFDDLQAHARHLRATIIRLERQPLRRLRSWVHVMSSRFALGRALAVHIVGLGLVIVAFHLPGQPALADELTNGASDALAWYPLDERLFYANAVAAGFAAMAGPVFYLVRWAGLRREYRVEFCVFKELALTDPAQTIEQSQAEQAAQDPPPPEAGATGADNNCFAILGLSGAATLEEVKEAYKALVKQNHPDRVHDMSPAFKKLAETETKKLNAAYRQALISAPSSGAARGATIH